METDRGDARLVITDQACNPLGPFCFANDDEDRLSTVEHQANGLLQQPQSIGPGSLYQSPSMNMSAVTSHAVSGISHQGPMIATTIAAAAPTAADLATRIVAGGPSARSAVALSE